MHTRLWAMVTAAAVSLPGAAGVARGMETDQFTVPDAPLPDIGRELDLKVDLVLRMLMLQANRGLARGEKKYKDNDFFARGIAREFTTGLPECTIEKWICREDFGKPDPRFAVGISQSVYGKALVGRPITMIHISPTINLYGHYVGTDKVGHFFQQGWDYYQTYTEVRGKGRTKAEAVKAAVARGVAQEEGIYGMFIISTYSNADLASDLAGLMFYRSLTEEVVLADGTVIKPKLVLRDNGKRWELNAEAGDAHCRPFVSDHWDESMNPCLYGPMLRGVVEENVKEVGKKWVAFHRATREGEVRRMEEMKRWHGFAYGHSGYKDVVTIVSGYFGAGAAAGEKTAVASQP